MKNPELGKNLPKYFKRIVFFTRIFELWNYSNFLQSNIFSLPSFFSQSGKFLINKLKKRNTPHSDRRILIYFSEYAIVIILLHDTFKKSKKNHKKNILYYRFTNNFEQLFRNVIITQLTIITALQNIIFSTIRR